MGRTLAIAVFVLVGAVAPARAQCTPEVRIVAIALNPNMGRGDGEVFRAVYRHCDGAATFRVVQLLVGPRVMPGGVVNLGYTPGDGRLYTAEGSCAPGAATRVPADVYGSIDCARSRVTVSGDDITVEWAIDFDPARFSGAQEIFFDAKGGLDAAGTEHRLGWTRMGSYVVEAGAMPTDGGPAGTDAGPIPFGRDAAGGGVDAGAPADRPAPGGGGCGCASGADGTTAGLVFGAFGLDRLRSRRARARRRLRVAGPPGPGWDGR